MPQALRHETVIAFEALIRTHTSSFKAQDIQVVISEAAALIGYVCGVGNTLLQLIVLVAQRRGPAGRLADPHAGQHGPGCRWPHRRPRCRQGHPAARARPRYELRVLSICLLTLCVSACTVKSPLLQGAALGSLIRFFQTAVNAEKEKAFTYAALLQALIASVDGSLHKSSFSSVAQAIAGITIKVGGGQVRDTVTKFVGDVKSSSPPHVSLRFQLVLASITIVLMGVAAGITRHRSRTWLCWLWVRSARAAT